jgi:hypothetical protein
MQTDVIPGRLSSIATRAEERLQRMGELIPEQRRPRQMDFEQYLKLAQVQAQSDPVFRQQLEAAMAQYQAAQHAQTVGE